MKPSLLLFSFLSLLLLSISDNVLGSGHHKRKHAHAHAPAPAPALVVVTPPVPVEAPSPTSYLAPAEGPTQDCSPYAAGLLECLDYLQAGSSDAKPGGSCCSDLRDIAKQDVSCLCALLSGNDRDFGFQINSSRVLSLPYTCSFTLPTSNECNSIGSTNVADAPQPSKSDIASPPLPPKSAVTALPITVFTIAAGIASSMLLLIA